MDVPLHHGGGGRVPLLLGAENGLAVDITNLCGGAWSRLSGCWAMASFAMRIKPVAEA